MDDLHEHPEEAGNDGSERDEASRITPTDDGSNVVTVDFGKKK